MGLNGCSEQIEMFENITKEYFVENIQNQRKPAVLKGIDIGECVEKWTVDYLVENIGNLEAKVHVSSEDKMDFITKNFVYKTLTIGELLQRITRESQDKYFLHQKELYYFRSLSSERRGREVSDISKQFPQIANDIFIPDFFNKNDFFSSVFRISSKGIQLWTHYDIMDNLLIQVVGRKRVVLFSPSDASYLYMKGDKSQVLDVDNPDLELYPHFTKAKKYECILEPGDVLFLPALWFHNTKAMSYGIAVNIFWKNLEHNLYDKNDYYGNKDLIPAVKALQNVESAARQLSSLPEDYKQFYLRRCLQVIEGNLP